MKTPKYIQKMLMAEFEKTRAQNEMDAMAHYKFIQEDAMLEEKFMSEFASELTNSNSIG
jgi:hypothetical protein